MVEKKIQNFNLSSEMDILKKSNFLILSGGQRQCVVMRFEDLKQLHPKSFSTQKFLNNYRTEIDPVLFNKSTQKNLKGLGKDAVRNLDLQGVGFRVEKVKQSLHLFLGFSRKVVITIPGNLTVKCPTRTSIKISGKSSVAVDKLTFQLLRLKKPSLYKQKGIFLRGYTQKLKSVKKK